MESYRDLKAATTKVQPQMLKMLGHLVRLESPTENRVAVNRCVTLVEGWIRALGGRSRRHRRESAGDLLAGHFGPVRSKEKPLLLLGHLDTVWPLGTLKQMPFRLKGGRAWGPGVLDMKAGVVMALTALRVLLEANQLNRPVMLLLNSDEETGSRHSRALTESLAKKCAAVFVLEPAQGIPGAYKTARKGVAQYRLEVHGIPAHSGVDFGAGHSAVLELGSQIRHASAFTDLGRGITVNAGIIGGGTRSNVVPAYAWAEFDVRIARAADAQRLDRRFRSLHAIDRKCRLEVSGGLNRPPMERTPGTVALFERAATMARGLGFLLKEAATGGGSDGNFTSALGIATLDGMGAVGEGAHADHESILLDALVPRTALLAAMIGGLRLR
ncbi:MAG: M20 family metallopeptidase [Acidobacteriaceae bacterium]